MTHPCLDRCDDNKSRLEIHRSKEILESEYELDIFAISYPNGDYGSREIDFAKDAGYECAITTDAGFNGSLTNRFKLRRNGIYEGAGLNELAVKASGVWAILMKVIGKQG